MTEEDKFSQADSLGSKSPEEIAAYLSLVNGDQKRDASRKFRLAQFSIILFAETQFPPGTLTPELEEKLDKFLGIIDTALLDAYQAGKDYEKS